MIFLVTVKTVMNINAGLFLWSCTQTTEGFSECVIFISQAVGVQKLVQDQETVGYGCEQNVTV